MKTEKCRRNVFAISGLPPEVLAVAMAKYSRSVESIKTTIEELTEEKSAQFHEKWVLGYGDASVADMALVAIALENVSILASKAVEDNRLASYQEKSTRYVSFDLDSFYRPPVLARSPLGTAYEETLRALFATYQTVMLHMQAHYEALYPRQETMSVGLYSTRIKARALDVARYLLPTATLTNFGMIMSARSLRHAISKLKASPVEEMQSIAEDLQRAATEPAYNPQAEKLDPLLESLASSAHDGARELAGAIRRTVSLQVSGAPTLVKRTEPRQYISQKDEIMKTFVKKYLNDLGEPDSSYRVEFVATPIAPEDELVATLFYAASTYSFRQILVKVVTIPADAKADIIQTVQGVRTQYDWPSREFEVGQGFVFDTLMDYGAFRDLQRHRMCTQIHQPLGAGCGYETPRDLSGGGLDAFQNAMAQATGTFTKIAAQFPHEAAYVLPLAFRKRTLFKMNLRELFHIVELRTKPGGHFSYRELVYEMFEQFRTAHPALAASMRAVSMDYDQDFFKR